MAKDQTIIVRVDAATKRRIEAAARRQGLTITTFLLQAAEEVARRDETMTAHPVQSGACPTFFKARCLEARRGGAGGYEGVGSSLLTHAPYLLSRDHEDDECEAELDVLESLIQEEADEGVLAWFDQHLPACMDLIPKRRRQQLLKGIYEAVERDGFPML